MIVENIVSRAGTGLGRVVDNFGTPDAPNKLEAFVVLAQKDPMSAKLLIERADVARAGSPTS